MDFLKKHYEKVLLGVVLLGLTVAVGLLPFILAKKRADLIAVRTNYLDTKIKPLAPLDMAALEAVLQRAQTPSLWNFTRDHNLVNPVLWQRLPPDNRLAKGELKKIGPDVLEVTDIKPLLMKLTYNAVSGSGIVGFTNAAASKPALRSGERRATKDEKNDLFTLLEVKGPPDKPTELVLQLVEGGSMVSISPTNGFERVEGYEADLKYPLPPAKSFTKQRRDMLLTFAGESYKIVAITSSNVVVSAEQNKKKTTINYKP